MKSRQIDGEVAGDLRWLIHNGLTAINQEGKGLSGVLNFSLYRICKIVLN